MVEPIILIGAGGHCRSCIEVIESQNRYQIVGVIAPTSVQKGDVCGYAVIGVDDDLPVLVRSYPRALVAVGQIKSAEQRQRIFRELRKLKFETPTIYASSAMVSRHSEVGDGTIVMHRAILNAGAKVGVNCIINSGALIEHDAEIGDHCHISTGAIVNGAARIGPGSFVGSGAVVLEGVCVGENSLVGAQVLVAKDLPAGSKVRYEA